jgi:septal ring factor EnvC (AmiA/AmiB activator)
MATMTPALQLQASQLREKLSELEAIRVFQDVARSDLQSGLSGLQEARAALAQALREGRSDTETAAIDRENLRDLASAAGTLQAFAESLATLPAVIGEDRDRSFSEMEGQLNLPFQGPVLRRYQEADAAGIVRPGIILSGPAMTLVRSPWAATIRYAGTLLDYGEVVIAEPQSGYLLVLAGLGQVYVNEGDVLDRDAPIGLLGGADPDAEDLVIDATEGTGVNQSETLYIELRRDGIPVNPEDWFDLKS